MKAKAALVVLTDQGLETALRISENWQEGEKPELWLHQSLMQRQSARFIGQPVSPIFQNEVFDEVLDGVQKEKGNKKTQASEEREGNVPVVLCSFNSLKEVMPRLWSDCSLLIFIMATGIVVRQIAPYIQSKDCDPAVLVLDEKGEFVISLLSGHLGGANAWAKTIAHWLNAKPVVTTATDVQGLTAPDEYARRFGWTVEPVAGLKQVNRFLLDQGYLKVWTDYLPEEHPFRKDKNYFFLKDQDKEQAHLWITTQDSPLKDAHRQDLIVQDSKICGGQSPKVLLEVSLIDKEDQEQTNPLLLIPRIFSVGVGCRRGASKEQIIEAIELSLGKLGISPKSIRGLYSIRLKADELGIIEAAQTLGVPFRTFLTEEIQAMNQKQGLKSSEYVKEKIGVDGVCEAASLLGTQLGELILPKQKWNGVTVAISKERSW